jgi:CBS domain-containing protein/nitroimidazol reductase NimA-like FMN-containing flavoprotein (pyridoxamine 5'-phosphate oxidase superfamily)
MRVSEFMSTPVATVSPKTTIAAASSLLLEKGFNAVPVVDRENLLVGIVSESDLLRGRVIADPRAHLRQVPDDESSPPHFVGEVMTKKVLALPESEDAAAFAAAMIANKFKTIPVVSGRQVVGIVSASDLLRGLVRTDNDIAQQVAERLREYAGGRELLSVSVADGVVTLAGDVADPHRRVALLLAETVPGVTRARVAEKTAEGVPGEEGARPSGKVYSEVPRDHRGSRVLGLEECLAHLQRASTGRLAFIHDGSPVILPVNHGVDDLDIVFRTTWGSKLHAAAQGHQVAFEVDRIDENRETGWSVLVVGTASVEYENSVTNRLDQLGVASWAGGTDEQMFWVRVHPHSITGREITEVH